MPDGGTGTWIGSAVRSEAVRLTVKLAAGQGLGIATVRQRLCSSFVTVRRRRGGILIIETQVTRRSTVQTPAPSISRMWSQWAMGTELKRLLDIARPRRPGDEIHRPRHSLITPTHRVPAILIAADHLIGTKDDDMGVRHHVNVVGCSGPDSIISVPVSAIAAKAPVTLVRSRSAARPRSTVTVGRLSQGIVSLRIGRHLHLRRQVLAGQIIGHRMGHAGKVGDAFDRGGDLRRHGDEQIDRSDGDSLERSGTSCARGPSACFHR